LRVSLIRLADTWLPADCANPAIGPAHINITANTPAAADLRNREALPGSDNLRQLPLASSSSLEITAVAGGRTL
jgi:hypothetical protein